MQFTKVQGCGNDFILIDYTQEGKSSIWRDEYAPLLCDRNKGIGADGVLLHGRDAQVEAHEARDRA